MPFYCVSSKIRHFGWNQFAKTGWCILIIKIFLVETVARVTDCEDLAELLLVVNFILRHQMEVQGRLAVLFYKQPSGETRAEG